MNKGPATYLDKQHLVRGQLALDSAEYYQSFGDQQTAGHDDSCWQTLDTRA